MTSPTQTSVHAESRLPEVNDETDTGAIAGAGRGSSSQDDLDKQIDGEFAGASGRTSGNSSPFPVERDATGERQIVSFSQDDAENPYNWTRPRKAYVVVTCIALVTNSTIGSAIPAGASRQTAADFDLTNESYLVLPISIYLIGYVLGPLVFAPMSESFGRKWVIVGTFVVFTAFHLGCALAPTFAGLVIMRLLVGIGASTPVSVIGGIFADIFNTPKARGRAMTGFMAATTWGPLIGPIISGYVATVSWRWTYWVALIIAGATWPFVLLLPETFGPVLLRRKAQRLRRETGSNMVAPIELEEMNWGEFFTVTLTRPLRMFLFEYIVLFSCLYLALAFAIFYTFFQAFPIIYEGTYGFSAGEEGLAFIPVGVGALLAGGIYLYWEHYLEKAKARPNPPAWCSKEEYNRLPIACLGAPLFAISLFWLGWTARPDIHWIVPVLAALPFGIGFLLIFMALINYIVDSYEAFAASSLAAASCSRSIFGIVLPFAARPMYSTLGIGWACSLLGFISILMGVVPFLFLKYGEHIRANSKWCQELKRQKAEDEARQSEVGEHRHVPEEKV